MSDGKKTFDELLAEFAAAGADTGDGADTGENKATTEQLEARITELEASLSDYEQRTQKLLDRALNSLTPKQKELCDPLFEHLDAKNPLQKLIAVNTVREKVQSRVEVNNTRHNAPASSNSRPKNERDLHNRLSSRVKNSG